MKDNTLALFWSEKAAQQGHRHAFNTLGWVQEGETGMAPDYARAVARYRKGAEQSHNLAQYNLGRMYHSGTGVEQNDTQALYWFKQAALQGHCASQKDWRICMAMGKDVGKIYPLPPFGTRRARYKRAATRNIRWAIVITSEKVSNKITSRQYTGFEKRQTRVTMMPITVSAGCTNAVMASSKIIR